MSIEICGHNTAAFADLRDTFATNFSKRGELGASLCVWHQGQKVVDLWGGYQDKARTRPWQEDTLSIIFSSTKGLVALCFLMLAEQGAYSYDEPVAKYWPEFAAAGKTEITIRKLLNHRAGLIAVDTPLVLAQMQQSPDAIAKILAAQTPCWTPGEDQGYHGVTFGLYTAELFERICGQSLGTFLREKVALPLGADVHLGLAHSEEQRVSPIHPASLGDKLFGILPRMLFTQSTEGRVYRQVALGAETNKAFANPAELGLRGVHNFNRPDVHAMELPWANGIANARALATIYGALANGGQLEGVRIVEEKSLLPLYARQSWSQKDRVLRKPLGWSQGFLKEELDMFSPNTESFGHPGAGGALGWCDPVAQVAIGYVPNKMAFHVRSPRARALATSLYRCLD